MDQSAHEGRNSVGLGLVEYVGDSYPDVLSVKARWTTPTVGWMAGVLPHRQVGCSGASADSVFGTVYIVAHRDVFW